MIDIESLSDFFEIELSTSNYFYAFENQSNDHVFEVKAVQTRWEVCCIRVLTISKHEVFKIESWENIWNFKVAEVNFSSFIE